MGVRALQRGRDGSGPLVAPRWRHPGMSIGWWTRMSTLLILGIQGAADAEAGLVEDVGVDLGGGDVGVTQQLLDGPQVVVVFK